MSKFKFTILIMGIVCFVFGCGTTYSNSRNYEDEFMESVVSAIKANDASIITDEFSSEIQGNKTINSDAETFINFINGEIVSYEYESGYTKDVENKKKGYSCVTLAHYTLETTEDNYDVEFVIVLDALTEDKKGVQSLGIQELEDRENEVCVAPDYKGIYTVTSDNHDEIRALEEAACEED